LTAKRKTPLARDDVALAHVALVVNSRESRSQSQLHIHIGCLSRDREQKSHPWLYTVARGQRVRIGSSLHKARLCGRRVTRENLAEMNPFRLPTEAHPDDGETRAHTIILVTGVELARGRDGFVLLAARRAIGPPAAERVAEGEADTSLRDPGVEPQLGAVSALRPILPLGCRPQRHLWHARVTHSRQRS